jgi:hypothetical protein
MTAHQAARLITPRVGTASLESPLCVNGCAGSQAAIPPNFTLQPFAKPRTGTTFNFKVESEKSKISSKGA